MVGLFVGWIKARRASGAHPASTAAVLLARMDEDPHGFCGHDNRDVLKTLEQAVSAALEKSIRARFREASRDASGGSPGYHPFYWSQVLRGLFAERNNLAANIAFARETGPTVEDCLSVAAMLHRRGKHGEALSWVEDGLDLEKQSPPARPCSGFSHHLMELRSTLLSKLGRSGEALESAWEEYLKVDSNSERAQRLRTQIEKMRKMVK